MNYFVIRWKGLYYNGYSDSEGTMWCSAKAAAKLLTEEESERALKLIPVVTCIRSPELQLKPVNEDYN